MKLHFLIFLLIILAATSVSYAKVYKWKDENGKTVYSDKPPKDKEKKVETVKERLKDNGSQFNITKAPELTPIKSKYENFSKKALLQSVTINLTDGDSVIGKFYIFDNRSRSRTSPSVNTKARAILNCKFAGDLTEQHANYVVSKIDFDQPFYQSLQDNGYVSLADEKMQVYTPGSGEQVDYSVEAVIEAIDWKHCSSRHAKNFFLTSQNATYLKVAWQIRDNFSRQVIYSTTTAGSDDKASRRPISNGTSLSMLAAFRQATDNLLADRKFADLLISSGKTNNTHQAKQWIEKYAGKVDVLYGKDEGTIAKKMSNIEKGTFTIRTSAGHGSGFAIAPDLVITNQHVIAGRDKVSVISGNKELSATVVAQNSVRDVALLKVQTGLHSLVPLHISSNKPVLSSELYVIGTPLDEALGFTITKGIISSYRKLSQNYYQTDAAINPGNSGGPVFNAHGNVIAITVAGLFNRDGSSLNINYLIPIEEALTALGID